MFNQQMMQGMQGGLPNFPTTKELWKNEPNKYRQWMIMFGLGILAVFALLLTSTIMNIIGKDQINHKMQNWASGYYGANSPAYTNFVKSINYHINVNYIGMPIAMTVLLGLGILFFGTTVSMAYKQKSFAIISQWTTFAVGLGALLGFFQLIQMLWQGTQSIFDTPGGLFQFINYFLIIGVYFGGSMQVSKIRRLFATSERISKIKNSPEYKAAQEQMNSAASGQAPSGQQMGPFGPMMNASPIKTPPVNTTTTKTSSTSKSKERRDLEAMSVSNLKSVAKKLSILGYNTMKKPELIETILRVSSSD